MSGLLCGREGVQSAGREGRHRCNWLSTIEPTVTDVGCVAKVCETIRGFRFGGGVSGGAWVKSGSIEIRVRAAA